MVTFCISTYAANKLLDHLFGGPDFSPPATYYCGLFIVLPQADGTGGLEVAASGYNRVAISNNTTSFPAATGGLKTNGVAIDFGTALANYGNTAGAAWYDAATSGNLIAMGEWSGGLIRTISAGQPFSIGAGSMQFTINDRDLPWTYYLQDAVEDLLFGRASFARPGTLYVAAYTTLPNAGGLGGIEPTLGNYARVSVTNDGSHFPAASGQLKIDAIAASFTTPNVDQPAPIIGFGWADAVSGGNIWMASSIGVVATFMQNGVAFGLAASGIQMTLL